MSNLDSLTFINSTFRKTQKTSSHSSTCRRPNCNDPAHQKGSPSFFKREGEEETTMGGKKGQPKHKRQSKPKKNKGLKIQELPEEDWETKDTMEESSSASSSDLSEIEVEKSNLQQDEDNISKAEHEDHVRKLNILMKRMKQMEIEDDFYIDPATLTALDHSHFTITHTGSHQELSASLPDFDKVEFIEENNENKIGTMRAFFDDDYYKALAIGAKDAGTFKEKLVEKRKPLNERNLELLIKLFETDDILIREIQFFFIADM